MWYKCLNPNCGFVFPATEGCDKCPNCGKQYLREATNKEVSAAINQERKPPLDEQIAKADARAPKLSRHTNKNGTPNTKDEKSHETQPTQPKHGL